MEAIYSSADILLQASLREWSGLAVIEAMSCGCVPVVSDIPSFRMLTAGGIYGRLFDVGDAEDLARVVLSLSPGERISLSESTREHFQLELSFDAMARRISKIYDDVIAIRDRRADFLDSQL
jgi:glycosyltransferase involved in cell wall biosynthesis